MLECDKKHYGLKIIIVLSLLLNIIAVFIISIEFLGIRNGDIQLWTPVGCNYPVVRTIGWVTKDEKWEPIKISAVFNNENFNLFNSKSSINIKAEIKVFNDRKWTKQVKNIFVSQRYIEENGSYIGLIELTPKFKSIGDENTKPFTAYKIILN